MKQEQEEQEENKKMEKREQLELALKKVEFESFYLTKKLMRKEKVIENRLGIKNCPNYLVVDRTVRVRVR